MNKYIIVIFSSLLAIIASCEGESFINFGFDTPINKDSKGFLVVDISQPDERLFLSGYISLSEGKLEVILMNPNGVAVFSKTLVAPDELRVNETFEATWGYWKLVYTSSYGKGYIDLHISNF